MTGPIERYYCPSCGTLMSPDAACPGCARPADASGVRLVEVHRLITRLDAEAADLQARLAAANERRDGLLRERAVIVADMLARVHAERSAAVPTATAVPAAAAPAAPGAVPPADVVWSAPRLGTADARPRTVQNLLFVIGGILLGIGAIVFTVLAWSRFGMGGRVAILGLATALALALPPVLRRRDLRATAETVAAIGAVLLLLDAYGAYRLDLAGLHRFAPAPYAATVLAATAVILAGYGRLTRLAGPGYAALLVAQPVAPLLAAHAGAGAPGWSFAFAATAAVDALVIALGRTLGPRITASVLGVPALTAGLLAGLTGVSESGTATVGRSALALLACGLVLGATAYRSDETAPRAVGIALAVAPPVAGAARTLDTAVPGHAYLFWSAVIAALAALAVTVRSAAHRAAAHAAATHPTTAPARAQPVVTQPDATADPAAAQPFGLPSAAGLAAPGPVPREAGTVPAEPALGSTQTQLRPAPAQRVTDGLAGAAVTLAGLLALSGAGGTAIRAMRVLGAAWPLWTATPDPFLGVAALSLQVAVAITTGFAVPAVLLPRGRWIGGLGAAPLGVALAAASATGPDWAPATVSCASAAATATIAVLFLRRDPVPVHQATVHQATAPTSDVHDSGDAIVSDPHSAGPDQGGVATAPDVCSTGPAVPSTQAHPAFATAAKLTDGSISAYLLAAGAAVLSAYALLVSVNRPGITAAVAAAVTLLTGLVAVTVPGTRAADRIVRGVAAGVAVLVLPLTALSTVSALGGGTAWVLRTGLATVAVEAIGFVALRRRAQLRGYVLTALSLATVVIALTCSVILTTERFGLYALIGRLVIIAAVVAIGLRGRTARLAALPGDLLGLLAAGTIVPTLVAVLAGPWTWLDAVWSGAPGTVGLTPRPYSWVHHPDALDAVTVAVFAASLIAISLATAAPARFAAVIRSAMAAGVITIPVVLAASGLHWPGVATTSLVLGLAAVAAIAIHRSPAGLIGGVTALTGAVTAAAGLTWLLATRPATLYGLGGTVVVAFVIGTVGRTRGIRVTGWAAGFVLVDGLAVAAVRAGWGGRSAVPLALLAVAALASVAAPILHRRGPIAEPAEAVSAVSLRAQAAAAVPAPTGAAPPAPVAAGAGAHGDSPIAAAHPGGAGIGGGDPVTAGGRVIDVVAHGTAFVALAASVSPRQAALVACAWGVLVGIRLLWPDIRPGVRPVLLGTALALELIAWWLLAAARGVHTIDAYSLPLAAAALLAGWAADRTRQRTAKQPLSSWATYGVALVAAFGPSLLPVLGPDPSGVRRLLLGAGAILVILAGAQARMQAPVVIGGAVAVVLAVHELVLTWSRIPAWIPLTVAGALIILVAATYERRRRDWHRLRASVGRLR